MAHYVHVDLAYGDATNPIPIIQNLFMFYGGTTEDQRQANYQAMLEGFCEVPAGETLYVRGWSDAAPPSGYNAVAVGIGG
jgi:hypothetical protein